MILIVAVWGAATIIADGHSFCECAVVADRVPERLLRPDQSGALDARMTIVNYVANKLCLRLIWLFGFVTHLLPP